MMNNPYRIVVAVLMLGILLQLSAASNDAPAVADASPAKAAAPDTRNAMEKLSDPDPAVRRGAVITLGRENRKNSFQPLARMLNDEIPEVRRAAVNALLSLGDERTVTALAERFIKEDVPGIRMSIVMALGDLKSAAALAVVRPLLKDPVPTFRSEAIRALGKIKARETFGDIAAMLNDEAEGVRLMAADTVQKLEISAAVPFLVKNLENRLPALRRACARALGALGDETALEALESLGRDKDASVAAAAREAAAEIRRRVAEKEHTGTAGKTSDETAR